MQNPFESISVRLANIENLLHDIKHPPKDNPEEILTREQTCALLDITKSTLWKRTRAGKIKSYGQGRRVYFKKSEVLDSLNPIKIRLWLHLKSHCTIKR